MFRRFAYRLRQRFYWLLVLTVIWPILATAQPVPQADNAIYQGIAAAKSMLATGPRLSQPDPGALQIHLAVPKDAALPPADKAGQPLAIGAGQPLPEPYRKAIPGDSLVWSQLADGEQAATIEVTSSGAAAVRLQIVLDALPPAAQLRFFAPGTPDQSAGVLPGDSAARARPFWSPTIAGDTLGLEIDLPASADVSAVRLHFPRLSRLSVAPKEIDFRKLLSAIGTSGACEIDVACDSAAVPQSIIDSVAEYVFTKADGGTYLCTGTLLNDTDPYSQVPYFLTAHHCIASPSEAASMEFYWFFERAYCGAPAPTKDVTTGGGATLLSTGQDTDYSLVRLNEPPPAGVGMSGWSAQTVATGESIFGIHHPHGDLKKISYGDVTGLVPVIGYGSGANFIQVRWTRGVTEPGSSGSGLWLNLGGQPRLVGQLLGGGSSCQTPNSPDYYGRFDLTFPHIKSYVAASAKDTDSTPRLLNISTNAYVDPNQGLIAGFIVTGGPKRFAIMGENTGGLADPEIEVVSFPDLTPLASNDNWQDSTTGEEVATQLRPPGSPKDAALALTLPPGQYLAILRDKTGHGGRGLVSVTEISGQPGGRLLNISTNGYVDTGRGMVAGFIVTGGSRRFAVMGEDTGGLANPEIQVESFPDGKLLATNDDWQNSPTGAEVASKLRPPGSARDSALAITLPPGQYLAILRDKSGHGGRGLVSVTEISP